MSEEIDKLNKRITSLENWNREMYENHKVELGRLNAVIDRQAGEWRWCDVGCSVRNNPVNPNRAVFTKAWVPDDEVQK